MPQVPRYEQQVQPGALPGVQVARDIATPDVTAVPRAAAGLAEQSAKLAMQEKSRADDAWTKQTYAEMVRQKNNLLHGDGGALRKQGRDALAALPTTQDDFEKYADELEKGASNESQRQAILQMRLRESDELRATLQRHAGQETERLEDGAFKSLTESLSDDSINNPAKAQLNLSMLRAAANDYADRKGWTGEEGAVLRKGLMDGIDSKVHGGIIMSMLRQDNDLGAKAYFDANKDAITDAGMRGQVEQALEEGGRLGTAMRLADKLVSTKADEATALKDVRAEFEAGRIDAKTRQVTEMRVKQVFDERRQFDAKGYADNLNQAYAAIRQTKRLPSGPVWGAVQEKDKRVLMDYLESVTTGKPIKTDVQTKYDLQRMAAEPEFRDEFMKLNLMAYRNKLSESDFNRLSELQMGLIRGDGKAQKDLDDFRSDDRVVSDAMPDSVRKNKAKAAEFSAAVAAEQTRRQAELGRKLTNKELQEISDTMALEVVTDDGVLWDTTKPTYQVEVPGIPREEIPGIVASLRRKKQPITQDNIIRTYKKFLEMQRAQ